MNFDLKSKEGIAKFRHFMEHAADLVVGYGGSLSGEHGDGQARAELLPKMFGPELMQAFRKFKSAWDPDWKMNPGKLMSSRTSSTKIFASAPNYAPWEPLTRFQFPADQGSLANATLRCVGVGKCRREEGGVMCPSYRATHEEEHSTRGRAHLLWEMTQGEVIRDGWRSEEVKQSLDLCLACKGCKSDCPVGVDVATYKAEFLSHYYEGRVRPRSAYAFGNIDLWARLGVERSRAGESRQRNYRSCATSRRWSRGFRRSAASPPSPLRLSRAGSAARVGTACVGADAFVRPAKRSERSPATQISASERPPFSSGPTPSTIISCPRPPRPPSKSSKPPAIRVVVPQANLCCGRPLYDFGMLDRAEALLLEILDELSPEIEAGIPIVGLEPSCVAVFRDELLNLFPHDERAGQLGVELRVAAELEGFDPVRLEPILLPDAMDCGRRQPRPAWPSAARSNGSPPWACAASR